MQDKTINNALLALRKQGGAQGKLAEVLLDMRGIPMPSCYQHLPLRRGAAKHLALEMLREGPKTTQEIGKEILHLRPEISQRDASNRAYQALLRLKDKGIVRRDGRAWRIMQPAANTLSSSATQATP